MSEPYGRGGPGDDGLPGIENKSARDNSDIIAPDIITQMCSGDADALATIHEQLYISLWRFALHLVKSPALADDIIQDVFLSLWTRRTTIKPTDDLRAYLFTSVRNRAYDNIRHNRVVDNAESAVANAITDIPITGQPAPPPDISVERAAFMKAYQKAVRTLSDRESTILYLRWEEELTLGQIAQSMGISIEGVRKTIARSQKKLQKLLSEFRG